MSPYNGFSPAERAAFAKWQAKEIQAGRIKPAAFCVACGQREGIIHHHAEDYSKPWSEAKNIPRDFHLCFTCHMMLHSRFNNPACWARYVEHVREGRQYPPVFKFDMGVIRRLCSAGWERVPFIWWDEPRAEISFDRMNLRLLREA